MTRLIRALALAAIVTGAGSVAQAGVVRLVIEKREPIGTFGAAGAYERISGHYDGELDPAAAGNRVINDLRLAPRNARGKVEYSATFSLTRPIDAARASGVLIYDVPNRGGGRAEGDAAGHMHLISGWQGDIAPGALQTATVPVARQPNGDPIAGPVLVRWVNLARGTTSLPLEGGINTAVARPPPLSTDTRQARLVRKKSDADPGTPIAPDQWAFGDCGGTGLAVCLKDGFDPAFAYELVYTARDPKVLGIGFAAVRDLVAFLRAGQPTAAAPNPTDGAVRYTVGIGTSQAGNFLRSFLHLGFNAAEDGKPVFDGLNPRIAARHTPMNFRFAVPGGAADLYEPGSEGPLWWSRYDDRTRGFGTTSLLDRCTAAKACPKIFEFFGSAELWGLRMSPDLIGTDAAADIPLPANVRRYYTPSVTHGGGGGGFAVVGRDAVGRACALPANSNPASDTYRALTVALIDWVKSDKAPPPSRYPTLAAGDLVAPTRAAMGFPVIPGAPSPDGKINPLLVYDFGAGFNGKDLSGAMTQVPPRIVRQLDSRVPRTDADGNETSGIPSVQLQVPLGTYLGWNVQGGGYYAGAGCGFQGGYIPFSATRAERLALQDPRPSLEERYGDHAGFVARVKAAAEREVAKGFLLPEDAQRLITQAEASEVLN
jgi:hypothetical protein